MIAIFLTFITLTKRRPLAISTILVLSQALHVARSMPLVTEEPYQRRPIFINTYNPTTLDLHGVHSVAAAKLKVERFLRVARHKNKATVDIITGRGKHRNRGGNYGTLFQELPKWLQPFIAQQQVKSCTPAVHRGRYTIVLNTTPDAAACIREKDQRRNAISTEERARRACYFDKAQRLGAKFKRRQQRLLHTYQGQAAHTFLEHFHHNEPQALVAVMPRPR